MSIKFEGEVEMKEKEKYSNWQFAKDLWHFLKISKTEFILLSILLVVSFASGLITPILIAKVIDFFISANQEISIFYMYLGLIFGVEVFGTALRHYTKYALAIYTNKVQKNAKVESFQKILEGGLIWHDSETTGEKMHKIMEGERMLGAFMNFYINKGVKLIVTLGGVIGVFAYFNLKYALMISLFMILYLLVEFKMNKKVAQSTLNLKIMKELASGKAYEFSSNIHTIKSLGMEQSSGKQVLDKEEAVLQAQKIRRKASTMKWVAVQLIATLFFILFIFLVGKDILIGVLSIGSIVIYLNYFAMVRDSLGIVSLESNTLIDVKYGLLRLMQIYRIIPDIEEEHAKNLKEWNRIKIKNLGFKYKTEKILDNLNLDIKRGEKIGIVGLSGSGKSTLFKLLLKLYTPQKGMIFFGNRPIASIKRDSLLKRISVVPQETELFNLSLKDNITLSGKGKFNPLRYKQSLLMSQVSKFIPKLKDGDLTFIGEKGVKLSGGERQRLGIARALYKDSDIVILDESTSNLDYETEKKIIDNLAKLKDKTMIISAHRIQTLKDMDKIIFIDKGRVVEEGSYVDLIKKKGAFYRLLGAQERKR
jgi:ABC-type multidrug transport system fused ATPase/permease subunit